LRCLAPLVRGYAALRQQIGDHVKSHKLYTGDGRSFEIEVPEAAVEAAEEWAGHDLETALANAAPYIIAAELKDLAAEMDSRPANEPVTADDIRGRVTQLIGE
jgi:hypothetical protein